MEAISNQVIYFMINISKRHSLHIIQVYAPTSAYEDGEVEQLHEEITATKRNENAKFFNNYGRLNAKIIQKANVGNPKIGKSGQWDRNNRGEMLIVWCSLDQQSERNRSCCPSLL